jgi:hypothetical protein
MLVTPVTLTPIALCPCGTGNAGASITTVSWTVGSGSIPAGTSVLFDDAADVSVARVDNLPEGATSVDVPANIDATQVATIKFSVSGASSASWNFCLTSVTVSMR